MKKIIGLTAALCVLGMISHVQARDIEGFLYYHYQCVDSSNTQLWYETSPVINPEINQRCRVDGGQVRITKIFR